MSPIKHTMYWIGTAEIQVPAGVYHPGNGEERKDQGTVAQGSDKL